MNKTEVRKLFPVTRNLVYLNHAAVGPLSMRAYEAMEGHARDQREFGALHWREWYHESELLRQSAARLINAGPEEIAILKNTSEGLSFVAEGFRWKHGQNVVTTDLEFPSNFTPWKNLERRGVELRVVESHDGAYAVGDVAKLIDANTGIVTVSSVAFHNGFTADLDAIGELCASRGVLFCVDAIQSLGAIPIDVTRSKIAFLAADGHKWLCGPEGAAIFFVAAQHRDKLDVIENGWTNIERRGKFINCSTDLLPDSRRFEAGSLNTNGIYGLHAAIDLLHEIGPFEIAEEVKRMATLLADELEGIGYRVRTPRPIASGIVAATPPAVEPNTLLRLHRKLEENGVVCAPREGMLRFAPHFYNDERDVERVIQVLRGSESGVRSS
ncbi:MAG TPA: aminotransferase class V-fold PLP-dependent enzyme [Thermoanaerobaculia bacterium]|nr:aminotransferase class V-fold PLP-dependent enzyme [Thermoanaerobaculia bacterium]